MQIANSRRLAATGAVLAVSLLTNSALAQAQYAGNYSGTINTRVTAPVIGTIESGAGVYIGTVTADGAININQGGLIGTVSASGAVTFSSGSALAALGIRSATIANNQLSSAYGDLLGNGTTQFRLNPSTSFTAASGGGSTGGGTTGGGTSGGGSTGGGSTGGGSTGGGSAGALVANYAFNGNLADAVSGTNAIQFNGVTYVPGVSGQALQFDGNGSVVTFGSTPLVTSEGPFSVSFWFRPTAARLMVPVRVRTPATEFATRIGLNANDSSSLGASIYFGFRGSAGIISRDPRFYIQSILNQWVHLTFVYKGGNKSSAASFDLIVNGERLALSTVGTIGGTSNSNEIGRDGNSSSYVLGTIDEFRITSTAVDLSAASALYAVAPTVTGVATAPSNLVGYRNKVGQTFSFVVTGATGGAVWGTDIYTDDSTVGRAAVHAGVVAPGETKTVSVTILPGQSSYPASNRNGVTSASWGAWSGSYSFAGAAGATGTATVAPTVVYAPPATQSVAQGGRLNLTVTVGGVGPFTYQWFLNGTAISGAIGPTYNIASVSAANAGTYTVRATNPAGTTTVNAGTVSVANAGAPSITLQPLSKVVAPGARVSLLVSATGSGNLSYQWRRGSTAIPGATQNAFEIFPASVSANGTYTCTITNSAGSLTTDGAVVTVSSAAARPANISCRTRLAAGGEVTPGFYVDGTGTKRVLVRAVGPALAGFGVEGAHTDPRFDVYRGSAIIASNDNFDGTAAAAFAAAGAFTLPAGSRDAALVVNLTAGQGYTVRVGGAGNASGIVLLEVYDLDDPATATSRLSNVSVLGGVGTGDDVLILGVVVGGAASVSGQSNKRTLLIRGAGPTLGGAPFNVPGVLADPQVEIFDSNNRSVLDNNDWSSAPFVAELQLASNYVSAFAFGSGSKDAATLALLDPGAYTIVVKGADGGTGQSLVEVYEVP
jgi:hypothetical protein